MQINEVQLYHKMNIPRRIAVGLSGLAGITFVLLACRATSTTMLSERVSTIKDGESERRAIKALRARYGTYEVRIYDSLGNKLPPMGCFTNSNAPTKVVV